MKMIKVVLKNDDTGEVDQVAEVTPQYEEFVQKTNQEKRKAILASEDFNLEEKRIILLILDAKIAGLL